MTVLPTTAANPLRDPQDRRLPRIAGPSGVVIFGVTGDLARKKLMPAIYDLANRGLLRPGMRADVTCIDPLTVRDTATYERPRSLPEGIPYVIVNGRVAVDEGRRTDELAGRALRKSSTLRR